MVVNSIRAVMSDILVREVHFLQHGNTLDDFLTNLVFDFVDDFQFNDFEYAPAKGRRIINLDKIGTPNIRRKI